MLFFSLIELCHFLINKQIRITCNNIPPSFIGLMLKKMSQTFTKVCSIQSNKCLDVTLYRSTLSGMRVAFVPAASPIVNGWFSFATKATSDDGLPHTLEHLVFMGSHKYPYKGFLDSIANRCFASGLFLFSERVSDSYTLF